MKKSFLKTGKEETLVVVDKETGDVLFEEKKSHSYIANANEQFFLGYFGLASALQNLSGPAIKTYFYLLINYKSGTLIGLNKAVKKQIRAFVQNKSLGTIDNSITELCRSGLLVKQTAELAGYYVNPRFAYMGSSKERKKALLNMIVNVNQAA